ncbi:DEDD exonuclease domain-containing protein [Agilicoccus flavus]|uniref:DEDD exonuclease domain-containing protein n=1 Tax=Agilicoccus flavus TaxID=2775968 RepID=UPI001CF6FA62|nr:DEDD exonuclease domain-containing protein [Agilicoccus flavus]
MHAVQGTFDDLGTPLSEVTFVVVDLETTGSDPRGCDITEIGAVKVRGGQVLGEFATLVKPGETIPAFIAVLTGITDAMVADAPRIASVLPGFLEFARGAVLVAHNAPFDIGFLKANAARLDLPWPRADVLDTVYLARQVVPREECGNHKLSSLARYFGASVTPDHRALHDARATVDVLHGLLERVGNLGVATLEDLATFTSRVTPAQRRKRHLADALPSAPGVYVFEDRRGRPLYVGTSTDIRRRVRTYFTASETRRRMGEMVGLAERVRPIVCATPLEAQVRELRLIADAAPPYNRRSTRPHRRPWLKLTVEAFPRLSIVHEVRDDGAVYAGPFATREVARSAVNALHEAIPLRRCTTRLSPQRVSPACALAELDRCGAPCDGRQSVAEYADVAALAAGMLSGDGREVLARLGRRMSELAASERYEDAAVIRDRTHALVRACARAQRLAPLARAPQLVAARRRPVGGWEVVCIRHGRLAGTTTSPRGADPMPYIDALLATAEVVAPPVAPAPAALPDETDLLLRWLGEDGVRIVELDGTWASPAHGAGSAVLRLDPPPPSPDGSGPVDDAGSACGPPAAERPGPALGAGPGGGSRSTVTV